MFEEAITRATSFFSRPFFEVARDLVDVGIVALLVYAAFKMLKGRRTMRTALGVGLCVVGYYTARALGLVAVSALLDVVVANAAVIVVIIFQADIRRALTRVGATSFFLGERTARTTRSIEEVTRAVAMLAHRKVGGLIVFERRAPLDDFIERGTEIDAYVKKEIIYSIFLPTFENPIHDGAIVIRAGRIWQAGALLPLSKTIEGHGHLGTRHRAALGISEETDAVAIVVSEERGALSLCFDGNLLQNLDQDGLSDALQGLFYDKEKKKRTMDTLSPPPRVLERAEQSTAQHDDASSRT